jgi:uncharacterized protein YdhG (YjbR/CyaY superfamily)
MQIKPGTKFKDVETYIAVFPEETQKQLQQLRNIIKKAAPTAEEVISYNMPAYKLNSILVYFAGYENHIGFYPTSSPMQVFAAELTAYKTSKGAIQFPLNEPLPTDLIKRIVKFRIEQTQQQKPVKKVIKKSSKIL